MSKLSIAQIEQVNAFIDTRMRELIAIRPQLAKEPMSINWIIPEMLRALAVTAPLTLVNFLQIRFPAVNHLFLLEHPQKDRQEIAKWYSQWRYDYVEWVIELLTKRPLTGKECIENPFRQLVSGMYRTMPEPIFGILDHAFSKIIDLERQLYCRHHDEIGYMQTSQLWGDALLELVSNQVLRESLARQVAITGYPPTVITPVTYAAPTTLEEALAVIAMQDAWIKSNVTKDWQV